jgi:hypothetical protein
MPLCGFNQKMIKGISMFAEGLFEATVARADEEKMSLPEAFKIELRDIGLFLQALEDKHQEVKRHMPPEQAAAVVADLAHKW